MQIDPFLLERAARACQLSGATDRLTTYAVGPDPDGTPATTIVLTEPLRDQLTGEEPVRPNDWRCLNDSVWSEVAAVRVVAYRMLHRLRDEGWPRKLLDVVYLDDATRRWAEAGIGNEDAPVHRDANGHVLADGDTVVLVKDLKVKGAGFTAKRGTAVRNVRLVADHAGQIEGRVESQRIVILTAYVKKK